MSGLRSEDWRRWESVHSVWMVTVAADGVRLMLLVQRSLLTGGRCLLHQRPGMTQLDQRAGALPVVWQAGQFNAPRSSPCFTAQVFHLTSGLLQHYDLSIIRFWGCAHCRCRTCSDLCQLLVCKFETNCRETPCSGQLSICRSEPAVLWTIAFVSDQFVDLNQLLDLLVISS